RNQRKSTAFPHIKAAQPRKTNNRKFGLINSSIKKVSGKSNFPASLLRLFLSEDFVYSFNVLSKYL
ncbi:MAG: hypothetical protein LH472_14820, partial [Pyrinomonadaceae bacterium]|nr:hypothetical protein [Pyrinomonadaceae bacterium]